MLQYIQYSSYAVVNVQIIVTATTTAWQKGIKKALHFLVCLYPNQIVIGYRIDCLTIMILINFVPKNVNAEVSNFVEKVK